MILYKKETATYSHEKVTQDWKEMNNTKKTRYYRIILLLTSISIIAPTASALTHHTTNPSTQTSDTTISTYNIQQAINNAPAGALLQIPPGTYTETLRIDKPLHLKGHQAQTFLAPTSGINGQAIWITAPNVILSDLAITNNAEGLYTTAVKISAPNTILENCTLHDTPIGVAVWSNNTTITRCQFIRCEDEGIALLGSPTKPCSNTTIASCLFQKNCDGIELQYTTHSLITSCRFEHNTHAGIDAIQAENHHNTINDCLFTDNQAFGIYLSRSRHTLITDCRFSGDTLTLQSTTQNSLRNSSGATIHLLKDATLSVENCLNVYYTETHMQTRAYESSPQPLDQTKDRPTQDSIILFLQPLLAKVSFLKTLLQRFQGKHS